MGRRGSGKGKEKRTWGGVREGNGGKERRGNGGEEVCKRKNEEGKRRQWEKGRIKVERKVGMVVRVQREQKGRKIERG